MDELLLRRLLGAAVLLTTAFILASLLPDPVERREDERVVRYDLRSGKPLAEPVRPAAKAEPERRPALRVDETLGSSGAWFIQVGSFENQANARSALEKLYGMGLPTVIQSVSVGKALWYRVRVGPFDDEAAAQKTLARIRKEGYAAAKVVRPETLERKAN